MNLDIDGWTVLHEVITQKKNDLVSLLLEYGAEVDKQEKQLNRTPLHVAGATGNIEAAKLLRKYGARTDLKDNEDLTYLELAYKYGYRSFLQKMVNLVPSSF